MVIGVPKEIKRHEYRVGLTPAGAAELVRDAWTKTILAADYETHMAAVGQAQANASLVAELFKLDPPAAGRDGALDPAGIKHGSDPVAMPG